MIGRRAVLAIGALVLILLASSPLKAEVLEVGEGKRFQRIEEALARASPGDTIRVYPLPGGKAYERPALLVRKPRIAFVGAAGAGGKRVRLDGSGFEYSGAGSAPRAVFQFDPGADGCLVEGFEIFGARNESSNGAGVRINQANDVTIRGCDIHDCDMGIMSNGQVSKGTARNQWIEACEIHENGSERHPGYNHNLYLGGTSVVVRGSHIWGSTTGHNLKSRAHLNWIEACYVHDSANREFDLVDEAGNTDVPESHSVIIGCAISKAKEVKGNRAVIHFGQDGGGDHRGTLFLIYDTIITPYLAPVVELSAPGAALAIYGTAVWDGGTSARGQVLVALRGGASLKGAAGAGDWISQGFAVPAEFAALGIPAARDPEEPFGGPWREQLRLLRAPGPALADRGPPLRDVTLPPKPREDDGKPDIGAFEAPKAGETKAPRGDQTSMPRRHFERWGFAASVLFFAGAVLCAEESSAPSGLGSWWPLFQGVECSETAVAEPRVLRILAVRIDLQEPGVEFLVTPSNGDRPGETDGLKTSSFLRKYGCQVAVNASPYEPVLNLEGSPKNVIGLSVSRGDKYSEAEPGYGALLITRENRARIAKPPMDLGDAYNAVGGFTVILQEGRNIGEDDGLHPRTAVGISPDGRYLFLLVIDGRQPEYSEGATTRETAEILLRLGATEGLNLDGGGSTALVVDDRSGGAKILNRPIHAGVPGTERVNANHLGIFARPLPDRKRDRGCGSGRTSD